jgi:glycosyltransferase involved in cell wall biosynthesis
VRLNDTAAFAHAVRAIHGDIYLRRRVGQRNRQTVENYFIDSCATRYEQVFEAAIDRRLAADRGVAPTSQ